VTKGLCPALKDLEVLNCRGYDSVFGRFGIGPEFGQKGLPILGGYPRKRCGFDRQLVGWQGHYIPLDMVNMFKPSEPKPLASAGVCLA